MVLEDVGKFLDLWYVVPFEWVSLQSKGMNKAQASYINQLSSTIIIDCACAERHDSPKTDQKGSFSLDTFQECWNKHPNLPRKSLEEHPQCFSVYTFSLENLHLARMRCSGIVSELKPHLPV